MNRCFSRCVAWCCLALLLASAPRLAATRVGTVLQRCPLCGNEYATTVLLSYFSSGPDDPGPRMPAPSGVCPRCLFAWKGQLPATMNEEQSRRVRQAIASWPESLSPTMRQQLRAALDGQNDEAYGGITDGLAARCDAAQWDMPLPAPAARPRPTAAHEDSKEIRAERQLFLKLLPDLLEAQRQGKPALMPSDSAYVDRQVLTLQNAFALMERGNSQALEYFLRWAVSVDKADLREKHSGIWSDMLADGLRALAAQPSLAWPADIDLAKARCSFAADCLRYVHDEHAALPDSLRQMLKAKPWNEFSSVALRACTVRRDRAAADIVSKDYVGEADEYYEAVGIPADIPKLAGRIHRFARKISKGSTSDGGDFERQSLENAIRMIQLKSLLDGGKLTAY